MDIRFKHGFSLSEALDMVYDDGEVENEINEIFIEPPEPNVDTDEDSADELEGGLIHNLTGRQLRAPAEIKFFNNRLPCSNYEDVSAEPPTKKFAALNDQIENGSSPVASTSRNSIQSTSNNNEYGPLLDEWIRNYLHDKKKDSKWIEGDLHSSSSRYFPVGNYQRLENMSCVDVFELFFDDEVINYLVDETQKYAQYCNKPDPKISLSEMKCFLGILILSGYNSLPSKRMYWDVNDDVKNYLVCNSMRRNRFLQVQSFIHFTDNTRMDATDKAWKIRPLMDKIKKRCLQNFVDVPNLSYDEAMIKYYGRHGCKQYIRGKPIRFGYKMWCLNSSAGYLINFDLYQGKNPRGSQKYDDLFGKCSSPLLLMLEELHHPNLPYNIHVDNLFTGLNLFSYLKFLGYHALGTIRANRIPQSCPLEDKKTFSKNERGAFQQILEKKYGILLTQWLDNSVVIMASTDAGVSPISTVKRYSQKQKKHVMVNRPDSIARYNRNMGGTDQMDQGVANYRVGIRSKKWYWSIFTWILDAAINNAWFLYKQNHAKTSNLEFRRELAQVYLARHGLPPKSTGPAKSSVARTLLPSIRYDGMHHYVAPCNRRRCAGTGCKSFGRTMCSKCDIGLCVSCFASYHTV